jgi:hypothetical protein
MSTSSSTCSHSTRRGHRERNCESANHCRRHVGHADVGTLGRPTVVFTPCCRLPRGVVDTIHTNRVFCVRKKCRISCKTSCVHAALPALAPAALDRGDGSVVGLELVRGRGSIAAWRDSRPRSATYSVHCSLGCECGCGDVRDVKRCEKA